MKIKFLIPIICSIILGVFLGKTFFSDYNTNEIPVFNEGEKLYFVSLGSFATLDKLKESNKDYEEYLYVLEQDIYYLYGGITKLENIAKRIKTSYEKNYKQVSIKEINVNNNSFLNILGEYDKITTIASNDKDLLDIEKIVISNYKEMIMSE